MHLLELILHLFIPLHLPIIFHPPFSRFIHCFHIGAFKLSPVVNKKNDVRVLKIQVNKHSWNFKESEKIHYIIKSDSNNNIVKKMN